MNCQKLFLNDHTLNRIDRVQLVGVELISEHFPDHEKIIKLLQSNTTDSELLRNSFYKINLDKTIFHPQGGGQPSDEGKLFINLDGENSLKFNVKFVKLAQDLIQVDHFGWFEEIDIGEIARLTDSNVTVECQIDMKKRDTFTKIHSAGHVLDLAIALCGYQWKPGRGYHFADSPYCEYFHCNQSPESIPKFVEQLNERIKELLSVESEYSNVVKTFIPYYSNGNQINCELSEKFENQEIPSYLPPGQDVRFVKYGHVECACSGTHVDKLDEIGPFKVTKAKKQGKTIRISYNLSEIN